MKKILLSLLLAASIFSCGDKNEPEPDNGGKIKSPAELEAVIRVRGVKSLSLRAADNKVMGYDSVSFIARYATEWSARQDNGYPTSRGFGGDKYYLIQRDTIANLLLLLDTDVLYKSQETNNEYVLSDFINEYTDFVLLGERDTDGSFLHPKYADKFGKKDTIGYIPRKVREDAKAKITAAFESKDYDQCQRLFKEAYIFLPITGKQWRELKAKGIE